MKEGAYNLRNRQKKTIFECFHVEQDDLNDQSDSQKPWGRRKLREKRKKHWKNQDDFEYNLDDSGPQDSSIFNDQIIDRLPQDRGQLTSMLATVKSKIKQYKQQYLKQQNELYQTAVVPQNSIPICADVTNFNFEQLIKKQLQFTQSYFDVIMMDPPWKLSTSQPSRGVAIQYDSLSDQYIQKIPVCKLQKQGVILIWAINAKYAFTVHLMQHWGYRLIDSITWVKKTVNGKIAKGHGYYLQHAKQTCLVGLKGDPSKLRKGVAKDVIFSDRRGQSQKPQQIYDYIQELIPNGYYLQIFGRRNNLHNKWVTIGNQI